MSPDDLPPSLDPRRSRARGAGPLGVGVRAAAAALSLVVFVSSGLLWWDWHHDFAGNLTHVDAVPTDQADGAGAASPGATPGVTRDIDGDDQNILVIGVDNRGGLSTEQLAEIGTDDVAGVNTDTIMVIHIPADGEHATIISLPRDSYVDIPGGYKKNKINVAYADGACLDDAGNQLNCSGTLTPEQQSAGMTVLIKTIHQLTGLYIDHYIEVDLYGFYTISNIIGGVDVCLSDRWYDPQYEAGIDIPAGTVHLQGKLALAFVRERHGIGGDLNRIRRQQAFVSAVIRKMLGNGTLTHLGRLSSLLSATAKSLTVDKDFKPEELVQQLANLAAGDITLTTIPTGEGISENGVEDALEVDPAEVRAFVNTVIGEATAPTAGIEPTSPPSSGHAAQQRRLPSSDSASSHNTPDQSASSDQGQPPPASHPSPASRSTGTGPTVITAADAGCVR